MRLLLLVLAAVMVERPARADWWSYQADDRESQATAAIRFSGHMSIWAANFNRPSRACSVGFGIGGLSMQGRLRSNLRAEQGFLGCNSANSSETAIGTGPGVMFRVVEPIHLTADLEIAYTFPARDYELKNQIIIPLAIGLVITWPSWPVRPILSAKVTPLLYITDDSRDYALGGELGAAFRLPAWGDLAFTVGYHEANTMHAWMVLLAIYPY
jgi:hypothetical protein